MKTISPKHILQLEELDAKEYRLIEAGGKSSDNPDRPEDIPPEDHEGHL